MIADIQAEEAVLGAVLLSDAFLPKLIETGLRSRHFYRHGDVWRAMLRAHDEGLPVDAVTVPEAALFAMSVPNVSNVEAYARAVVEKSKWRDRNHAGLLLQEAAEYEDPAKVAEAEGLLSTDEFDAGTFDRERLAELLLERLDRTDVPGWAMPMMKLRARPRTLQLWGGHTSHGKTVWLDQIARDFHEQGANVWAWINEMTAEERILRHAAATAGVDLEKLEENDLTSVERASVARVVGKLDLIPFEIQECPGWSAEDIARDIRVKSPDVALVDILHEIPYENERDLNRIMRVLSTTAKLSGACVIATVHLNRNRTLSAERPAPTMSDIKGASSFEQGADVVGMVWRQDNETTGRPTADGMIYTVKNRQGRFETIEVSLDGERATFRPKEEW